MTGPAIQYRVLDAIAPEAELALVRALLTGAEAGPDGPPLLTVARLAGEGIALGAHQRAATALASPHPEPVLRRLSGGRVSRYGAGQVSVCLIVPDIHALTGAFTVDRVINRAVRGVLKALNALGLNALYGGRDVATVTRRPVALLGMEGRVDGVSLFQAVIGLERVAAPEPGWVAVPPPAGMGGAPWAALSELRPGLTFGALADALLKGYADATGRDLAAAPGPAPDGLPAPASADGGHAWSAPLPVPIGLLEAGVTLDGGALADVALRGDFITTSAALDALAAALRGLPPERDAVGRAVDRVFAADAPHGIMGLTSLAVIRDAVLDAAGRYRKMEACAHGGGM
ncbi:MAG: hypothetical protein HZA24_08835 [Nitrospirae bacterium]|nr:hypothetical protein [Nitrospirota bacterium]